MNALKKPKCKECQNEFERFRTTQQVCSTTCAIAFAERKRKKAYDEDTKDLRREFNKTDRKYQTGRAVRACNSYVLLRDTDDGCISCGNRTRRMAAGHWKSVGANPALRYHWANVNKQCFQCNGPLSGNVNEYRKGLEKKVGKEMVEYLDTYHPPQNLTPEDLGMVADWFVNQKKLL